MHCSVQNKIVENIRSHVAPKSAYVAMQNRIVCAQRIWQQRKLKNDRHRRIKPVCTYALFNNKLFMFERKRALLLIGVFILAHSGFKIDKNAGNVVNKEQKMPSKVKK